MIAKEDGAVLRRKRLRLKFTQRDLAFISGCSHAFIGQLERGESTVSPELAGQIAFRLQCDVEDLFEERRVTRVAKLPTASVAAGQSSEHHLPASRQGPVTPAAAAPAEVA